jgi:hypothetical protein
MALHGFLNLPDRLTKQLLEGPHPGSKWDDLVGEFGHEEIARNRGPACDYRRFRCDSRTCSARSSQRDPELRPTAHPCDVPERIDRAKEFERGSGNAIAVRTMPKPGSHRAGAEGRAFRMFDTALLRGTVRPSMPPHMRRVRGSIAPSKIGG